MSEKEMYVMKHNIKTFYFFNNRISLKFLMFQQ